MWNQQLESWVNAYSISGIDIQAKNVRLIQNVLIIFGDNNKDNSKESFTNIGFHMQMEQLHEISNKFEKLHTQWDKWRFGNDFKNKLSPYGYYEP